MTTFVDALVFAAALRLVVHEPETHKRETGRILNEALLGFYAAFRTERNAHNIAIFARLSEGGSGADVSPAHIFPDLAVPSIAALLALKPSARFFAPALDATRSPAHSPPFYFKHHARTI